VTIGRRNAATGRITGQFLTVQLHYLLRRYKDVEVRRRMFEELLPLMRQWHRDYRRHRRLVMGDKDAA
jgi:hypothetical protein